MRIFIFALWLGLQFYGPEAGYSLQTETSSAPAKTCEPKPDALFHRVLENDIINEQQVQRYIYKIKLERYELFSSRSGYNAVLSKGSEVDEIFVLYGEEVTRKIEENGKPISGKSSQKEEEKIRKVVDHYKNESEAEHAARSARLNAQFAEDRTVVEEILGIFNFSFVKEEEVDGKKACVYQFEPRKSAPKPQEKALQFLPDIRGNIWIFKQEEQWARLAIEVLDPIRVGKNSILLHRRAIIQLNQFEGDKAFWMPLRVAMGIEDNMLTFADGNPLVRSQLQDFHRFGSTTKIEVVGEADKPPQDF